MKIKKKALTTKLPSIGLERVVGHIEFKSPLTDKPTLTYKPKVRRR